MRVEKAVLTVLAAAVWVGGCQAATSASVRLCGRKLSEMMSRVCHEYNSPSWDDPVVEQPGGVVRRRRQVAGIADECCTHGCTFEQLTDYCSISTKMLFPSSESTLEALEAHMIADRSAEAAAPASEVGRGRRRGRGRGRARGRRCGCAGRRRLVLTGGSRKRCAARCARGGHGVAAADVGPHTARRAAARGPRPVRVRGGLLAPLAAV
ncbi:hypothetical protein JYU34_009839 [Plutella xylostella]|uniref:Insulin-like domain-containing protein n=1 Tax=Plutella xylostella TaxID=51655 RepID=A0ABQ7QKH0_PLUXY|nr:hypothetical protein JYU34_009839 [Plutella xylostella]